MTPLALLLFLVASPQDTEASKTQPRPPDAPAVNTRETATYRRIKAHLDSVPAIDTHDHLWPCCGGTVTTPGTIRSRLGSRARSSTIGGPRPSTILPTPVPPASIAISS